MRALVARAERKPREGYVLTEIEKRKGYANYGNLVFRNPTLALEERPLPEAGAEDIILRVRACGICGSEVNNFRTDEDGYILQPARRKFPIVLGHEVAGEVAERGKNVNNLEIGDMITVVVSHWCGECVACREGMFNQCWHREDLGITVPGGFEEFLAVKAKYCWKIDSLVDTYQDKEKAFEAGALVEPTTVAYSALFIRCGGIQPGDTAVVYGAGPIGLAAIALLRAAGAAMIIAFELSETRRKLAQKMGADYAFDPVELEKNGSSVHGKVIELTKGLGADMHVQATGSAKVHLEIERSLAVRAKVAQIGMIHGSHSTDFRPYMGQAGQIYGSVGSAGWGIWPRVIRLMSSKRIDMMRMVTARFSLDQGVEAFQRALHNEDGKIIIKP